MEDWDGDIKSTTNRATGVLSKITISKIWDRNPKFEHFEVDYYWTYNTSATVHPNIYINKNVKLLDWKRIYIYIYIYILYIQFEI